MYRSLCIPAKESSCKPNCQCRASGIGVPVADGKISTGVPNFRRVGDSVPLWQLLVPEPSPEHCG